MKKLVLIRHAKSSWDDPDLSDHDRPLNARGVKDAPRMGKRLKEKRIFPDRMITSTAKRALSTCLAMAEVLGYSKEKVISDRKIYHASEDQLLTFIQKLKDLNDHEDVTLLFGHNPGLTAFANQLADESIENIPTAGVVAIAIPTNRWSEVDFGCGKMLFFDFPKNKD